MIRRALLTDAPAILRLHMASIRGAGVSHYSPQQVQAWCGTRTTESYIDPISTKVVFVAEEKGNVLGFGQLDPVASVVEAVYVSPEVLRKGIGTQLLRELEAHAALLGLTTLTLDASLNSVEFYARAGYARVGEANHELAPGIFIPCVLMSKVVQPQASA